MLRAYEIYELGLHTAIHPPPSLHEVYLEHEDMKDNLLDAAGNVKEDTEKKKIPKKKLGN